MLKLYTRDSVPLYQDSPDSNTPFFGATEAEPQFGVASWFELNKKTSPVAVAGDDVDDNMEDDFRENLDGVEIKMEDAVDVDEDDEETSATALFTGLLSSKNMSNFRMRACADSVSYKVVRDGRKGVCESCQPNLPHLLRKCTWTLTYPNVLFRFQKIILTSCMFI